MRTLRGERRRVARHACASFWLLGMSFVILLLLLFTGKIKTDNGRGSNLSSSIPRQL